MRTLIFSCLLCGALSAQVGGPLIGYVPEGAHIRPMYGLPAAGAIGAPLAAGRDFALTAIAPTQNFALVTTADTGELMVYKPGSSLTTISGAATSPDALAISPSGPSAALWFPLTGKLQIVTGLPDSPSVRTIDASFLNASPLSIAISDDGQWAVGLWSSGVYAFGPSGVVIPLQTDPGVVALSFFHNNHDLALATATRATTIADVGGATQTSVLYDYSALGLLSLRAIAVSFDNRVTVVADSAGNLVNLASATISNCGCSPTGLYGLGGALFRLNSPGRHELKLFDAAQGTVLIVPPALNQAGGLQ
jgi:DNA-binding beta-propeller fold protein YncE